MALKFCGVSHAPIGSRSSQGGACRASFLMGLHSPGCGRAVEGFVDSFESAILVWLSVSNHFTGSIQADRSVGHVNRGSCTLSYFYVAASTWWDSFGSPKRMGTHSSISLQVCVICPASHWKMKLKHCLNHCDDDSQVLSVSVSSTRQFPKINVAHTLILRKCISLYLPVLNNICHSSDHSLPVD